MYAAKPTFLTSALPRDALWGIASRKMDFVELRASASDRRSTERLDWEVQYVDGTVVRAYQH